MCVYSGCVCSSHDDDVSTRPYVDNPSESSTDQNKPPTSEGDGKSNLTTTPKPESTPLSGMATSGSKKSFQPLKLVDLGAAATFANQAAAENQKKEMPTAQNTATSGGTTMDEIFGDFAAPSTTATGQPPPTSSQGDLQLSELACCVRGTALLATFSFSTYPWHVYTGWRYVASLNCLIPIHGRGPNCAVQ